MLEQLPYHYRFSLHSTTHGGPLREAHLTHPLLQPSRYRDNTRRYESGDPLHAIDWRVLARSDQWWVRKTHRKTQRPYTIIIDSNPSMFWPTPQLRDQHQLGDAQKHHVALRIAWNIGYTLLSHGNTLTLMLLRASQQDGTGCSWDSITWSFQRKNQIPDLYHSWLQQQQKYSPLLPHHYFRPANSKPLFPGAKYSHFHQPLTHNPPPFLPPQRTTHSHRSYLLISDCFHPALQPWLRSAPRLKCIHLLSRLEADPSWLKKHHYYRKQNDYPQQALRSPMTRGKDLLSHYPQALQQWQHSLASQNTRALFPLHTHSSFSDYEHALQGVLI